ncbi:Sec-independent protein translocase subunit TatA [Kineosporia succinea]|uniref:Sec-independent protein translocase protein TatA n=1 Tax=Kineosporia succinea TaxID=84632 RepID=A0ABT9P7U3_9ACTN|nr:Sec-independent protein translocase subunit TatA [Kineosporia succinea]MDP9828743.1 sec-independent protein translocase protein TatA [Kineosporia succinea]
MGFLKEPSHIIIVILVVVILFGSRRLPDAARGLGRSMRIFKSEIKQMQDDDKDTSNRRQNSASSVDEEPIEGRVYSPQQQREQPGYQNRNDI